MGAGEEARREGVLVSRRRPFRRIVEKHWQEVEAFPGSVGQALGGTPHILYDELDCGHVHRAVLLPKPSRSPYRRLNDGTKLRRCNSCPLEEVS